MSNQTQVTLSVREFGDRVNCYVVLDSPGVNSLIGSIQWDASDLDFDQFTVNPLLLSFNDSGDMQTTRWSMVNDVFAKNDGFMSFLIGCGVGYEMRGGAIGLLSLRKKTSTASKLSVRHAVFPVNWSAADKTARPVSINIDLDNK